MKDKEYVDKFNVTTAILVDGGFYRKRARYLYGPKTPVERANELVDYCTKLLHDKYEHRYLYRIFYYDCPPVNKNVYHPFLKHGINLSKTDEYLWMNAFLNELKHRRKFALRMGKISEGTMQYVLKSDTVKRLFSGKITLDDISENDFMLDAEQKGVDMRIGVDISSLAFKKQVNQIILISGDSDFVPAAKQARREGTDFILDPMRSIGKEDLYEHIDGIRSISPKTPMKEES